jgi:hypothetical protein
MGHTEARLKTEHVVARSEDTELLPFQRTRSQVRILVRALHGPCSSVDRARKNTSRRLVAWRHIAPHRSSELVRFGTSGRQIRRVRATSAKSLHSLPSPGDPQSYRHRSEGPGLLQIVNLTKRLDPTCCLCHPSPAVRSKRPELLRRFDSSICHHMADPHGADPGS